MSERLHVTGVSKDLKNKVEIIAEENGWNISQVVITALNYYFEHEGRDYDELYKVLSDVYNPVHEKLDLIKIIVNNLASNSIMYKEFMNHYFYTHRDELVTTKENYTEQLMDLENHVDNEMRKMRTMKKSR